MKALIISGGDFSFPYNISDDFFVICADSGYDKAVENGIKVNMLVGDMDSVKSDYRSVADVKIYPSRKDYTDTELAVECAIAQGAEEIILAGCIGNRVDHSLANIMLLKSISSKGIKAYMLYGDNEIYYYEDSITFNDKCGRTVSLIPISDSIDNIYTKGLDYPLKGESLRISETRGISNIITEDVASYSSDKGFGIVVISSGK